jgi:peroxiredoxin family protein
MPAVQRVTGLAIIVGDPARAETALRVAAAAAALGRDVALLFDGGAVAAVGTDAPHPLLGDALALGVRVTACQSGMADLGIGAAALAPGVTPGGLVGFLADAGDAQLLLA